MFKHFFDGFDLNEAEKCENMGSLPNIDFIVRGEKEDFKLTMEPKDYVIKYETDGASECVMGIAPDDEVDYLITIG
jgi:hypothetical protein